MGTIGPNAQVRVDGRGRHDLATLEWKVSSPKRPFTQIGDTYADRFTAGMVECTFSGEVQSRPNGTFAIDWDTWCLENGEHPLVCRTSGRTERLVDVVLDEVGSSIKREDGTFTKSIQGKFKRPQYE